MPRTWQSQGARNYLTTTKCKSKAKVKAFFSANSDPISIHLVLIFQYFKHFTTLFFLLRFQQPKGIDSCRIKQQNSPYTNIPACTSNSLTKHSHTTWGRPRRYSLACVSRLYSDGRVAEEEEREEHAPVLAPSHPPDLPNQKLFWNQAPFQYYLSAHSWDFFFMLQLKILISLWFVLTNNLR